MNIAVGKRLVGVIKLLMLLAALMPGSGIAQPTSDPVAEAKDHFRRGAQLYDLGKSLDAVVEFEAGGKPRDRLTPLTRGDGGG